MNETFSVSQPLFLIIKLAKSDKLIVIWLVKTRFLLSFCMLFCIGAILGLSPCAKVTD
jgi:hypothetical protein